MHHTFGFYAAHQKQPCAQKEALCSVLASTAVFVLCYLPPLAAAHVPANRAECCLVSAAAAAAAEVVKFC